MRVSGDLEQYFAMAGHRVEIIGFVNERQDGSVYADSFEGFLWIRSAEPDEICLEVLPLMHFLYILLC